MSARETTVRLLRSRIISLELRPGDAISEKDLAADLGVSRTPVRESVILLREEGLIQVFPQVGTFVSLVDPSRVARAQFLREAIECSALAEIGTPEPGALGRLVENIAAQRVVAAAGDTEAFFALDETFHHTLLQAGGRADVWDTVTAAKAHLDRARRLSLVGTRSPGSLVEQHAAVVDRLTAGDVPGAVADLRTHLRTVFDDIERIRARQPELFAGTETARPVRRTVTNLT